MPVSPRSIPSWATWIGRRVCPYTWSAASEELARQAIARYPERRSATMTLLYIAMREDLDQGNHRLTEDGMRKVADLAGVTPAQVAAVASFYTMYKRQPVGRYLISVCTSLSCWLSGADEVLHALEDEAGTPSGYPDAEDLISPEHVECIGACGAAPAVQVNYEFVEGVTPAKARRWSGGCGPSAPSRCRAMISRPASEVAPPFLGPSPTRWAPPVRYPPSPSSEPRSRPRPAEPAGFPPPSRRRGTGTPR